MKRLLNQWLPMAQLLRLQPIQMLLAPALLGKLLFLFFLGWFGWSAMRRLSCIGLAVQP